MCERTPANMFVKRNALLNCKRTTSCTFKFATRMQNSCKSRANSSATFNAQGPFFYLFTTTFPFSSTFAAAGAQ